jgi:hypothetical protein
MGIIRNGATAKKSPMMKTAAPSHYRPSSPGLNGKTVLPSYNSTLASIMSSKVYDQMSKSKSPIISKIRRVDNTKAKPFPITNISMRPSTPSKPKWK